MAASGELYLLGSKAVKLFLLGSKIVVVMNRNGLMGWQYFGGETLFFGYKVAQNNS